jgi:hypothetical protein
MKVVLALPYERKDEFKQKYGKMLRWNPEDKVWSWIGGKGLPEELKEFLARSYYTPPVSGGPRLTIELVPKTCWFSNVRNHVSNEEWKAISRQVSCGALNRCQICGGRSPIGARVECHEVFLYDEQTRTQKLVSLVALCRPCHSVKHIGRTQMEGHEPEALVQLATVNGWTHEAPCGENVRRSSGRSILVLSRNISGSRSKRKAQRREGTGLRRRTTLSRKAEKHTIIFSGTTRYCERSRLPMNLCRDRPNRFLKEKSQNQSWERFSASCSHGNADFQTGSLALPL